MISTTWIVPIFMAGYVVGLLVSVILNERAHYLARKGDD